MSLVSYSYSTDSDDDCDNNEQQDEKFTKSIDCDNNKKQHEKFRKSIQVSTNGNSSSNNSTERKHNKVIIPAFNVNSNDNDACHQKNIKPQSTKSQPSLLDILPLPKYTQVKLGDTTRKQSKLIPINALRSFKNKQKTCEKEAVIENNIFSNVSSTEICPLNMNMNKLAKDKLNTHTNTSTNTATENITSLNLSENQYKRLKKDESNIKDINIADMLENQQLRICKNSTEELCKASQEHVGEPSIPSRKKNHITYLAYKAKINEKEFKNQWSLNKMTRQQTRAKYGF